MKNILLTAIALATLSTTAPAQRMTLHEEFTGENCGPCAETNPDFWTLCNGGSNPDKLIHISYMVPIPTPGFYCERTNTIYTVRDAYYNVPFAPYGRYDGAEPDPGCHGGSDPGHPGCFSQADIDAEAARADSFTVTATSAWNSTYDQIITTVTITCTTPWTAYGSSANVRLRAALIQTNDFATPPGTNGETHFENVVQAMYPDATGTAITGTWAAGETHTYTITGTVPLWVDKSKHPYMVVWMQDDNNQSIMQAAKATPLTIPLDAALTSSPAGYCVPGTSGPVAASVTLTNTATTTLTSATIYYKTDGGILMSQPWTGSLAAGNSVSITLAPATLSTGLHILYDSVASPNGTADINVVNNASQVVILIQSSTTYPLPLSTDFESGLPANWTFFDANNDGNNWTVASVPNHASGAKAAKFESLNFIAGEADYIVLPAPVLSTDVALDFWVAYARYNSAIDDTLQVLYSTDCGTTWTALYNKAGTELATAPNTTADFIPTSAQWRRETVNLSALPAGSKLAFKGISDYGNNIYVDDINIHSSLGISNTAANDIHLAVYPNPARESATINLHLQALSDIKIVLTDATGRIVNQVANEQMSAGSYAFDINTTSLSTGTYMVMVYTNNGTVMERLSVLK